MADDGFTPDWDALTEEATELLSAYIRVDTVNPPGNETRACEFYGAILDREGIPYRVYEPADAPGRGTLVATLPGDGTGGKQLILLNHTDVVPFEREHWTVDPLGGEVSDGYIWGRGTLDMKGMGIMELVTFLLHHRHKLPLRRDLTFIAVADEEAGSVYGAEFLAREHPKVIDCVCVINEGGRGSTRAFGVERPLMQIGVAEKIPFWVRLRTHGRPGHGSVPTADNAADRLVRALQRIQDWERPPQIGPELRGYFDGLHAAGLLDEEPTSEVIERVAARQPRVGALLRNTISVTTLQSGVKHNVIPAGASATLDCRLLPGADPRRRGRPGGGGGLPLVLPAHEPLRRPAGGRRLRRGAASLLRPPDAARRLPQRARRLGRHVRPQLHRRGAAGACAGCHPTHGRTHPRPALPRRPLGHRLHAPPLRRREGLRWLVSCF